MVGVMRKLWVLGGLLALLTACATARSSTPPETGGDSGSIPSLSDLGPHFPDGELAAAVSAFRGGRNGEAAEVFEGFLENRSEDPRRLPARLIALLARHDEGVDDPTAADLERLADEWPLMADYAHFFAGSAHFRAHRYGAAAAVLERVPNGSTLWPRAVALRARAVREAKGETAALSVVDQALERAKSQRSFWELKEVFLEGGGHGAALKKVRREMASRFPRSSVGRAARRALGKSPGLSPAQWLRMAKVLFRFHSHKRCLSALGEALKGMKEGDERRCEVEVLWARTLEKMKRKAEAWTHFSRALACQGESLAIATFSGGRNRLRAGAYEEADRLLSLHISTFPERSTCDDATVLLAEARRGAGVSAADVDGLLLDQLGRWPDGDMVDDATWALVWPRIQSGAWEEAVFMADQVLDRVKRATSYRAEGRILYWKGRALQHLERQAEAVEVWKDVIQRYPLSWYCVLAHARLQEIDPELAQGALSEAIVSSRPLPDPLLNIPASLWSDDHFRRGVELLRAGLIRPAGRELKAARAGGGADEKRVLAWTRAALFHRAGVYDRSVSLARAEEASFGATWPVGYHRRLWEIAHPMGFESLVRGWADKRGIDPHWIWSIIREESGFNPGVESWANAIGLMQIILPTAKSLVRGTGIKPTPQNLRRPEVAVELGSKYLAKLLGEHKVIPLASSGYNAGSGAMRRWRSQFGDVELDRFVEQITYREARGYAKRVTRSLARYTWLYDGERMLILDLSPPGPPKSRK